MEYISAEEFLKQPQEIQNIFIEYIKEKNEPHLYLSNTNEERYGYNSYDIPLLTEGQLRKFIEDKTGYKICLIPYCDDEGIPHYLIKFKSSQRIENKCYSIWEDDPLQAYWQVVIKIVEDIINKKQI